MVEDFSDSVFCSIYTQALCQNLVDTLYIHNLHNINSSNFITIMRTYFKSDESEKALFIASQSPIWRRIYIASISDRLLFNVNFSKSLCNAILSVTFSFWSYNTSNCLIHSNRCLLFIFALNSVMFLSHNLKKEFIF